MKQIDLEAETAAARKVVEHVLQRGVGNKSAVPVLLAIDLNRRKTRWQGSAGHHVLGADGD